jgi:excisionase family DNA binding protein
MDMTIQDRPLPAKVTIQRAAIHEGVSEKTIRRRIADGTLKAYRSGPRLIRIDRESLLKMAKPMGGAA